MIAGATRTAAGLVVPARALDSAGPLGRGLVVGIGELQVSHSPEDVITTHALGSCVAVCVWDPSLKIAGLLHFLLPEAKINAERASRQPAAFADTGIPLLFHTLFRLGLDKKRAVVKLVGGAEVSAPEGQSAFNIGRRNGLAAKQILWRNGALVKGEALGGTVARSVSLRVSDGRLQISSGGVGSEL